jgi:Tol biopolymer transport system component
MGEGEREISEPIETGYTFYPIFSPDGARIAYLAEEGGPESGRYTLFVQPYPEGEPQSLGVFEQVNDLAWLPDGSGLVFTSGSWGSQQVLIVSHPGGEVTTLADGYQPRVPPLLP